MLDTTENLRTSFVRRTAWKWLAAPVLIVIFFGVGDVVNGSAADPAIVEGLTGLTPDDIEALSPEAAWMVDFQARAGGYILICLGLALAAIVWFGFRRWQRWSWFTMWVLPLWAITVSLTMLLADRPEGGPVPPPMVSGFIFFAYAAFWLVVSYGGFSTARRLE